MSRDQLRDALMADLEANGMNTWRPGDRYRRPEVHYLRLLRKVEHRMTQRGPLSRAARFILRFRLMRVSTETGISLPVGVAEPGLGIAHYGNIVVHSKARIGAGTRLNSGVNIGAVDGQAPTIGRGVYVSPGVVVYGSIRVGDLSVLGANAVVGRDVPSGVTVAGAPARVISERNSISVMPRFAQARIAQFESSLDR